MTKSAKFTDEEIAAVFFTINDFEFDNSNVKLSYNNKLMRGHNDFPSYLEGDGGGGITCNMDWCLTCGLTGGNYNCEKPCRPTSRGCGWFLTQECTKVCK